MDPRADLNTASQQAAQGRSRTCNTAGPPALDGTQHNTTAQEHKNIQPGRGAGRRTQKQDAQKEGAPRHEEANIQTVSPQNALGGVHQHHSLCLMCIKVLAPMVLASLVLACLHTMGVSASPCLLTTFPPWRPPVTVCKNTHTYINTG